MMKKERILPALVFVIFIAVITLLTLLPSASAVKVICSNETKVLSDTSEIAVGDKSNINGLGIAVANADETNAIGRLTADLFIDAGKASVSNKSYSQEVSLLNGIHTINFANITGEKIMISIDGVYIELYEGDVNMSGNLFVMIPSIDISDSQNPGAKVIIGSQKLSLLNTENPAEKVSAGSIDYVVELYSASDSGATIRVSKCDGGDISFGSEDAENISSNASEINTSTTNESMAINETAIIINDTNQSLNETDSAISEGEKKPNIFVRIFRWFKNLF